MPWRHALYARRRAGMVFGLARLRAIHAALGRPGAGLPVAHVVGTNGKGSTVAALEQGLRRHAKRTLAFTSPHLHRIGERVRVNGEAVSDERLGEWIGEVLACERALPFRASFFELVTLAACVGARESEPEVVLFEAGLGGRLDSTRVLAPTLSLVTRVGLDHRALLGRSRATIAAEKAGALRAGAPAWTVPQHPEAERVLRQMAAHRGVRLRQVEPLERPPRGLVGAHQRHNGALALAGLRHFVPDARAVDLDGVVLPGRFERRAIGGGEVVFDVAHDLESIEALLETWRAAFGEGPDLVLFGALADKEPALLGARLAEGAPVWWVAPEDGAEVSAPAAATRAFESVSAPGLASALAERLAKGARVLVCGSYRVVGPLRAALLELAPQAVDPAPLHDPRGPARL